jgi:hypothetical protein
VCSSHAQVVNDVIGVHVWRNANVELPNHNFVDQDVDSFSSKAASVIVVTFCGI